MRLHRFDDYPFHQGFLTLDVPATSDSHYNDGYWFGWYGGQDYFFFGLRLHPNNNVVDAYGGVVHAGEQRVLRASRALRPRPDELAVGPLSLEIVEPLRAQRLTLAENETGVSFDVTLTAVAEPFVENPEPMYRFGRLINHVIRYTGVCRAQGTATIDGRTVAIDEWHASRDHSWGIRSSMGPHVPIGGVEPEESDGDHRALRLWVPFEVDGHSGFFHMHEDADGRLLDFDGRLDERGGDSIGLTGASHRLEYARGAAMGTAGGGLVGGSFVVSDEAGREREYTFSVLEGVSVQGYGYNRGWTDGGGPGVYRGPLVTEADRFRLDDPAVVPAPAHVPEVRRLGLTEYSAVLHGPDGAEGMAMVEHMIYGTYRPYGFERAR